MERTLQSIYDSVSTLDPEAPDKHLVKQYEEQLSDIKSNLNTTQSDLLSLEIEDTDELYTNHLGLERLLFECSLKVRRLSADAEPVARDTRSGAGEHEGVKLPKIEVPMFDGNILSWRRFWEQFSVSVHERSSLSGSEKLVYLQHALRNGSANVVIDGLSQSGENYKVAVECLQSRCDRPRFIHQAHVKVILDAPSLKEGTGRELRKLHDLAQQHLRALKSMDYDPGPFMTSVLELKLDATTTFEWQKHSQAQSKVPHYQDLLDFINLRAQASESPSQQHLIRLIRNAFPRLRHLQRVTSRC